MTNDNLANMLGALLAYVSLRYVLGPSRWLALMLGATVGALVITKLSAVPAALAAVAAVAAGRGRVRRAEMTAVASIALVAVCGWYLVQNSVRYGDPLAIAVSQRYLQFTGGLGTYFHPYVVHPLHLIFSSVPEKMLRGFFYTSNSTQFAWTLGVSLAFWLALAAALAGLVPRQIGASHSLAWPPRAVLTLAALVVGAFASVWIVSFNTATYAPRLALVGLAALACLASLGLERRKLPVRAVLPLMLLGATIYAIVNDVLSVAWYR